MITLRNRTRQMLRYVFAILLILGISVSIYYLYFVNTEENVKILGTVAVVLITAVWGVSEYMEISQRVKPISNSLRMLVLMSGDSDREKSWQCEGRSSFLIGKGSLGKEVDIELGDTQYAEYISSEHAVLNYSNGYWYIEDLGSTNGIGLKKRGEGYALRLKPLTSYKIDEGDIIYISKAKILAR